MALRISVAAASLISSEACSLYQAVCGVQIRFGASFRGPWAKLRLGYKKRQKKKVAKSAPLHPPSSPLLLQQFFLFPSLPRLLTASVPDLDLVSDVLQYGCRLHQL